MRVYGIDENYVDLNGFDIAHGRNLNKLDVESGRNVCLMGKDVATRLFGSNLERPVDKMVKINGIPFRVVGTLEPKGSTLGMSWDNVIYNSPSLGYVVATHELIQQKTNRKNLTFYLPLTDNHPKQSRLAAYKKTYEEWVNIVIDELKIIHPNIEEAIEELNVLLWGHAMVQPLPGMVHGKMRQELGKSVGPIHFAHTDLAGASIFEEAFYQGLGAAKKVLAKTILHS